jgi:hypothetical protein
MVLLFEQVKVMIMQRLSLRVTLDIYTKLLKPDIIILIELCSNYEYNN